MYGSVYQKDNPMSNQSEIPLVKKESAIELVSDAAEFLQNPFNEVFDDSFWNKVSIAYSTGMGWVDAMNKVRIDRICEDFLFKKKDPLISLITEVHDNFVKHSKEPQIMSGFRLQLLEFAKIILQDDYSSSPSQEGRKYAWLLPIPNNGKKTILHLAAERNLQDIAHVFINIYPGLVYEPTSDDGKLPLELALKNRHDEVASLLVKSMLHQRVRNLFESSEVMNASLKFADIVCDPTLKKTIPAILDCCINADWPFVPLKNPKENEEEWSNIPHLPTRYHFHYRLLDGDQNSEPAIKNSKPNMNFDHRAPSCLQLLVDGVHSEVAMHHPVVRMLVKRKWEKFGRKMIRVKFLVYIAFLLFMALAFFLGSKTDSNSRSISEIYYLRTVCEVVTLIFTSGYFISEVDQMEKERLQYFKDVYNYLDVLGLVLILSMVPLRISGNILSEMSVASVAFLINFLRIFKYFPSFKYIGLYSKTFANMIYYDISKFAIIYMVVAIAFSGSVFLSLNATSVSAGDKVSFWAILLKEVRALAESTPFSDNYSGYHLGVVILLMINMFSVIVILTNILIGQLSCRYAKAVEEAEIQYSIDKTKFITKLEKSRFRFSNARITHYVDGDYVSDEILVADLLKEWNKNQISQENNVASSVRAIIEKMLKTKDKID